MEKLSKSKEPKWEALDDDGTEVELVQEGGKFLLSVKHIDDETWRCIELDFNTLMDMASTARHWKITTGEDEHNKLLRKLDLVREQQGDLTVGRHTKLAGLLRIHRVINDYFTAARTELLSTDLDLLEGMIMEPPERPDLEERIEAAKKEAVSSAFSKIISDMGFAPPEYWEQTKGKVWARLERMADWLVDDPWLEDDALQIDHGDPKESNGKPSDEDIAAMHAILRSGRTLHDRLSAYSHDAWSGWMSYLFSESIQHLDGTVTIPAELVKRWSRQATTTYAGLPDEEKPSNHAEADKIVAIAHLTP